MATTEFAPNPFHYRGPIQDHELFFNRDVDVQKVLERLRKGQSVSVMGRDKIGKTSFLYYVSHPQVTARHGFTPQKHLFFYVDCKRLADLSTDDCFDQIKAVMEKTVATWDACLKLPEGAACSSTYNWLEQVFSLFQCADIQLVVQLDDFDCLATSGLRLRLLYNLRALVAVHKTMAYLTTSKVSLGELQNNVPAIAGSPFFNIFWPYKLRPFGPGEVRRFLMTRLRSVEADFPESILKFISELGQDGPYELQLAGACAYDVWCQNAGNLCRDHCGEVKRRFNDVLQSPS